MERIEESDAEIKIVSERNLRIRTGSAHRRDHRISENLARRDRNARTVRTDDRGNVLTDQVLRSGYRLGLIALIINFKQVDFISFTADRNLRINLIRVSDAENLLETAAAL